MFCLTHLGKVLEPRASLAFYRTSVSYLSHWGTRSDQTSVPRAPTPGLSAAAPEPYSAVSLLVDHLEFGNSPFPDSRMQVFPIPSATSVFILRATKVLNCVSIDLFSAISFSQMRVLSAFSSRPCARCICRLVCQGLASSLLLRPPGRTLCPCVSPEPPAKPLPPLVQALGLPRCGPGQPTQSRELCQAPQAGRWEQGPRTVLTRSITFPLGGLISPSNRSPLTPQLLRHNSWVLLWKAAGCGYSGFSSSFLG